MGADTPLREPTTTPIIGCLRCEQNPDERHVIRHAPSAVCDCRPYLRPFHCAVHPSRGAASALARIDALTAALIRVRAGTHADPVMGWGRDR